MDDEQGLSRAKIFLLLVGVSFLGFGIAYLVAPMVMAGVTGLETHANLGVIEVRGFYGGQMTALGVLTIYLAGTSERLRYGLYVVAASLGGTGLGRLVGFLVARDFPQLMVVLFAVEIATTAAALWLARSLPLRG